MCDTPQWIENMDPTGEGNWVEGLAANLDPTDSDSWIRRGLRNIDPTTSQGRWNLFIGGPYLGYFNPAGWLGIGEEEEVPGTAPITPSMVPDSFDVMIREAAYALVRGEGTGSRKKSFITGPRGLEGPMNNLILGGGTSLLGS